MSFMTVIWGLYDLQYLRDISIGHRNHQKHKNAVIYKGTNLENPLLYFSLIILAQSLKKLAPKI